METSPDQSSLLRDVFKDDDTSDETKILISTLPRTRGWVTKHMYQYDGFWYTAKDLQGLLSCQRHFQAKDKDTLLATTPKCGTTWLKAMAFALVNRQTLDRLDLLLTTNPHSLVPFLGRDELPDPSSLASSSSSPRILGTHLPIRALPRSLWDENKNVKIVYMCRNPKDTFVSWWHFSNQLRPEEEGPNDLEDLLNGFCEGSSLFGPFWDHVLGYWEASLEKPREVLFLRYEEMMEEPASQLRRLAEFLGFPFSPEEERTGTLDDIMRLCSFDHMSNLEVNKTSQLPIGRPSSVLFRKGKVGDWVNYLKPEMIEKLDRVTELKMGGSQFKF